MGIHYFNGFIFNKIYMANSTRAELKADLRTELRKDPNGKIWSDDALETYINQAYTQIQKDWNYQWRENQAEYQFNTVVGTQQYALPSDFNKVELVRYTGTNLVKTSKVRLKREYTSFVSWTPSRYYLFGANIWFDVLPSAVWEIDLDYVKKNAKLSADTTESAYPDDYDVAIIKYAAFLAWSSVPWNPVASSKLQEYNLEIETLVSTYIFDDIADLTVNLQRGDRYVTQATVLDR